MEIVNYLRASIFHSSNAAFSLAMKNDKYLSFADKIISAKVERSCCDLVKASSDIKSVILINAKIYKYESFLKEVSNVKSQKESRNSITDGLNYCTGGNLNKNSVKYFIPYNNDCADENLKKNSVEYFLPYNNKLKTITITADGQLVMKDE